jgi:hypothetical protein
MSIYITQQQKEEISEWWENLSDEEMKEVFKQTGNFHLGGWGHDIGPTEEDVKDMYLEVHNLDLKKVNSNVYKIIIPKEEPKQETLETDKTNWKAVYEDSLNMQKCSNAGYESKIQELKQEIERMYSEEEVLDLLLTWKYTEHGLLSTKEWFEQFKKK